MSDQAPSVDKLCAIYRKMRDKKGEITKEYEEKIGAIEQQMAIVANTLKDVLTELNVKSMRTEHGTVYIQPKTKYYAMDWSVFGAWVVANNAVDLLEKRVAQGNMKQWLEDNPSNPPPGLQADTEITVVVRKN